MAYFLSLNLREQTPLGPKRIWLLSAALGGSLLAGCVPALVATSPMASGQVTDARPRQPVPEALIVLLVDREAVSNAGRTKVVAHTRTDANGQFTLPERVGVGPFYFVGKPPIHRATVRISKEGYEAFTTTQPCNGSDGTPSTPVHVFAALKPRR